jgi:hypothetical protein
MPLRHDGWPGVVHRQGGLGDDGDSVGGNAPALPEIPLYYGFREDVFALGFSREWVRQSPLLSMLISNIPEAKGFADAFLTEEYAGMGLAATSIEVDGGVRTTSFGPPGLSAGRLVRGMFAAVAIPNLLNAIDRGKQKRALAD